MRARNFFLLGLLAIAAVETVVGIGWLRDLKRYEASLLRTEERANLNEQLSAAEARAGAAKKRLDAALDAPLAATGGATLGALAGKVAGSPEFEEHFREALQKPEFRKKLAEAQKARLAQEYGPLLAQLGLKGDQLDKFESLIVDKQLAKTESGPLEVFDTQLRSVLGEAGYQTYVHYEDTARLRGAVAKIAAGLSATDAPLTPEVAGQLVESWYAALPPDAKGHPAGLSAEVGAGLAPDYELPLLPANSAEIAQGILSPPQLAAVQRLIRAQAAQAQLRASE